MEASIHAELTRPLDRLTRGDLRAAGGKGANLGEMVRAGLPVPPGFVLLTDAYRLFVRQAGIQAEIERLAGSVDADSQPSLDAASAQIRALFDRGALPPEISDAVTEAYQVLGGGPVAVRSSATAEDLPDASFAGQQETYLNICGTERVLEAVRRCWSSLWTGRALSYRVRNGIGAGDVALAVVVQQLVQADAAGVLFTADPIGGRRDRTVIDGAWGLGEAVVSGSVSPDHWLVDGATGAVLAAEVACKAVMTVRTEEGTEERPVPAARQQIPVLSADQVPVLTRLGKSVAEFFGAPQDIEWAAAGGRFYLLQSRPITTLFPLPAPRPPGAAGLRAYVAFGPFQGVLEPLTPAGIAVWRRFAESAQQFLGFRADPGDPPIFTVAANRIYADLTGILRTEGGRQALGSGRLDASMGQAVRDLLAQEERLRPAASKGGGILKSGISKSLLTLLLWRALTALVSPDGTRRRTRRRIEDHIRSLDQESRNLRTLSERLDFVSSAEDSVLPQVVSRTAPLFLPAIVLLGLAEGRLKAWEADTTRLERVGRSLAHNPTTEMDLALWQLSRTLKSEGAAPRADHQAVQAFLVRFGHRAVREIDVGMPRWREEPAQVLQMLENYMAQDSGPADPEHHFRAGAAAAEEAVGAIAAEVRSKQGTVQAALVSWLLRRFRQLGGIREWHKFYLVSILAIVRRVLMQIGTDLVQAGRLARPEDVFFVDSADIERQWDLRELVSQRRATRDLELKRRLIPVVTTSEGEVFYGMPPLQEGMLGGTGASAGVYEGVVRVVLNPVGARLEPGEILVAPGTDPAWTPLFLTAGALITETGGMISHGSVVAREYGIPAVVGVPQATTRLHTGQRVRVDGSSGRVEPLD